MSRDNWGRLVVAVLRNEELRELARAPSMDPSDVSSRLSFTSISSDLNSKFSFSSPPYEHVPVWPPQGTSISTSISVQRTSISTRQEHVPVSRHQDMRIVLPICYFGDFKLDESNRWTWKWSNDIQDSIPTHITESTSYEKLFDDIQKSLNVDSSRYDMVLRFQFKEHLPFSIPPTKITSDVHVNYLFDLNKTQMTPICVTLVRKDNAEGINEHLNGATGFLDTVQIAREDGAHIPETVSPDSDIVVTHKVQPVVQDSENMNANEFTNEDLTVLSRCRYEWNGNIEAGTSGPSSNYSRVAPDNDDLHIGQQFVTKTDLQVAVHELALKFNFEFR